MPLIKHGLRSIHLLVALALASPAVAQPSVTTATLVQTIHTSLWSPPSPDPAGINWRAETGDLWTVDNEVDEVAIFAGVNMWRHNTSGVVSETFDLTAFTLEVGGVFFDPAGGRVWFSDDNQRKIFQIGFGPDGIFATADDTFLDIDGLVAAGCDDPEDVTYNPFTGNLYLPSTDTNEICVLSPGPNGVFDDAAPLGDDVVTTFDTAALGIKKPKGIFYDPIANTLVVAARGDPATGFARDLFEITIDGVLLRQIDGTVPGGYKPSGVTMAPSTVNPLLRAYYVTDNAVDNGVDPNENDGKIHEFVAPPYAGNGAPVVDAGESQWIRLPSNTVTLNGFVSDDGHPYPPSALTAAWTLETGPAAISFGNPGAPVTTATFTKAGTYMLKLTGDDFQLTTTDTVEIKVDPKLQTVGCGIGPELALLLPVFWALRGRRRLVR